MELKIFRDTMPQAGTVCTVKAELPLETEILVSDYLPPVFKLVKCFAKPVILQKQLQPGRLTLEGYLRCTVYYQGEEGAGLCQTEQKLPFTKQLVSNKGSTLLSQIQMFSPLFVHLHPRFSAMPVSV